MLGFGFNKTKVLGTAEKFVQQGKLQNAIIEYEKITKEDPKDLTVLNTVGDLYSRIGQADSAVTCFRKVGDAYAAQGFTLKAIAMYKKLTKLSPSAIECTQKLAELYTQQGLLNDARSQYIQVADSHLRNNHLQEAAQIFEKILNLDPENAAMQTKLADLFLKLGKTEDAKNIYFRAADSLYQRSQFPSADESLAKVLALDPQNGRALDMRAQIALAAGNPLAAIVFFEQLRDLDSRPDALRSLLKAYLQTNSPTESEGVARKLFNVHHDMSGITAHGDHLLATGHVADALKFYREFEDRLLAIDASSFTQAVYGCLSRVKDDPAALETIRAVFVKAGDTTHMPEIVELLAHASVQAGNLAYARGLYKELIDLEPENPLHSQNYKQIVAKLGSDNAVRQLSPEEGAQAFMVDELEPVTAVVTQDYPNEIADILQAALTDSELFDSYNVPAKAIPPLEAALPKAPRDIRLNQRLASLYSRTGHLTKAANCCRVLEEVYRVAGFKDEARQYAEMATKYAEKAGIPELETSPPPSGSPAQVEPETTDFGNFFGNDQTSPIDDPVAPADLEAVPSDPGQGTTRLIPLPLISAPENVESPAETFAHEFDLSDEWESIVAAAPATDLPPGWIEPATTEAKYTDAPLDDASLVQELSSPSSGDDPAITDLLDEISFYLAQSMSTEAAAAIEKLAVLAPEHPSLAGFRQQMAESLTVHDPNDSSLEVLEPLAEPFSTTQQAPTISEFPFDPDAFARAETLPADITSFDLIPIEASAPQVVADEPPLSIDDSTPPSAIPGNAQPASISEFALDLEDSLGADFTIAPPSKSEPTAPAMMAAAIPVSPIAASALVVEPTPEPAIESQQVNTVLADLFAEFKEDVEDESTKEDEDPETHYNLGLAFKEMGLLDEAIGELQKVAQAVEHGAMFPQTMQAYTWLAQCFVDKGVPEASFRWYDRALKLAADEETRTAIHYEFGCAQEINGNRSQALHHFTEVYGANIDYRDVAERIKALKS